MGISRIYTAFTRKEIQKLFQTAKRAVKEPQLTILLSSKQGLSGRLLVVIPRAVGNAVTRNRLRRQLQSIFYEQKLSESSVDCAVIARPGAATLPFARLEELMLKAFSTTVDREPS